MSSTITAVATMAVVIAAAAGCSGSAEPGGAGSESPERTGSATAGPEEPVAEYSGSGDDEVETEPLSGDIEVRWEVEGNTTAAGDEAPFSVLLRCDPGPSFTSVVSESEAGSASGTKPVAGLADATCVLEVHADERGKWSVEFVAA